MEIDYSKLDVLKELTGKEKIIILAVDKNEKVVGIVDMDAFIEHVSDSLADEYMNEIETLIE